ncbi:MAG: hypothetical protein F4Y69_09190 [Chloroflexi bacterium]|nr:hypothetical protein [Chloroflexota bacterium]MYF22048.1 hypothetical protein [Chloroflexota bacterium]
MADHAMAIPRFLWWGFKRASWVERAIVVTGLLLLLGLVWPAEDSGAAVGTLAWDNPSQPFEFSGSGWADLGDDEDRYQSAVSTAVTTWSDRTDYSPWITVGESDNDIHWGSQPSGWGSSCRRPTGSGGSWAIECTKKYSGTSEISESDIVFNKDKSWDTLLVEGIAAHEFGHSGGLVHDTRSECNALSDTERYTMCPGGTVAQKKEKRSLTSHDITDMNSKY